jgi:hypothetical protein
MMLRTAKTLWLPVPFKRDQIDRLVLSKVYNSVSPRRDYNFRARPFLRYLAEGEKSSVARIPADKGLDRVTEPVHGTTNMLFQGREVF